MIRELTVRPVATDDGPRIAIAMTLETESRDPNVRVRMSFHDVTSFSFTIDTTQPRVLGLDIRDISERQWFAKRWEVLDWEHEDIHFYCHRARVDSVELLPPMQD